MAGQVLTEVSRGSYTIKEGVLPTHQDIQSGCMQRMALAAESSAEHMKLMATNYINLQADRDLYKRWYIESQSQRGKLEKQVSSLKGVVTKLKNRLKKINDGTADDRAAIGSAADGT